MEFGAKWPQDRYHMLRNEILISSEKLKKFENDYSFLFDRPDDFGSWKLEHRDIKVCWKKF